MESKHLEKLQLLWAVVTNCGNLDLVEDILHTLGRRLRNNPYDGHGGGNSGRAPYRAGSDGRVFSLLGLGRVGLAKAESRLAAAYLREELVQRPAKTAVMFFSGWVCLLIPLGSPHVRRAHMGVHRTCGEPTEIVLTAAHGLCCRPLFQAGRARQVRRVALRRRARPYLQVPRRRVVRGGNARVHAVARRRDPRRHARVLQRLLVLADARIGIGRGRGRGGRPRRCARSLVSPQVGRPRRRGARQPAR